MNQFLLSGELANLFGLNKQTILHYEKKGLIYPDYVDKNGYRYYSRQQYLTLEIIVNLRKLDVPLDSIKNYLEDKNPNSFLQLLRYIQQKNLDQIKRLTIINKEIQEATSQTEYLFQVHKNKCIILHRPPSKIFLSAPLSQMHSPKDRLHLIGHYNQVFFRNKFKFTPTGWVIDKNAFLSSVPLKYSYCFLTFQHTTHPHDRILPEGDYLIYTFSGTYHNQRQDIGRYIMSFLSEHNLRIGSDIYLSALKNHWLTDNYREYISQLKFLVLPLNRSL